MRENALTPGDELRCSQCQGWHPVAHVHTEGTEYTRQMLYFECRGLRFYAGQRGLPCRHEIRRQSKHQAALTLQP